MDKPSSLELLGEKNLPQAADPGLVTYCPSMDLIALGTTDQQVLIYRLNGQRVYGAAQKIGKLTIESIKWKPNGQLLGVAWSDGSVRLVGAESNKIVHQFNAGETEAGITCMGWGSNVTDKTSSTRKSASWDEVLAFDSVISEDKIPLDLPRDLSMIDIERSLPKLSLLPAGGTSEDVFCSRSSLDALFRPFDPKDNSSVDVMIVGTENGKVHVTIYDSFIIGSFPLPSTIGEASSKLLRHSSHSQSSTHSLLIQNSGSDILYVAALDLRFISATSDYLSLLASRSTALQNLLRYIHQVQILMANEWKSTQELPARFIRNVNETLEENAKGDIVQALYHSVATGHTYPAVKEWLVDELQERGLKRWEKAVFTGLENLRRLVHENMLPALDRCSVILSRFSGIAKFQRTNDTVGFSSKEIGLIMDTVACLHLVASKILIQVVDEIDLFGAFTSWMRYEIDRLAADSSVPKEDELEKEASLDHSKVLMYLQTCMTTSPIEIYLGDSTLDESKSTWSHSQKGVSMFELLDKQLQKQEQGLAYLKSLPRVELLCKHLTEQAKDVFSQIARAEKRNVIFGKPQEIGSIEKDGLIDMYMASEHTSMSRTYVAFVPNDLKDTVRVTRITYTIERGLSTVKDSSSSMLKLTGGKIKDLKLMEDGNLLVLWESSGNHHLLNIPYDVSAESAGTTSYHMKYSPSRPKDTTFNPISLSTEDLQKRFLLQSITTTSSFIPERLEVRDSTQSNPNTRRIVILSRDKHHYQVFALAKNARNGIEPVVAIEDDDVSMSSGS